MTSLSLQLNVLRLNHVFYHIVLLEELKLSFPFTRKSETSIVKPNAASAVTIAKKIKKLIICIRAPQCKKSITKTDKLINSIVTNTYK
jgi:hypothetical protein